MNSDEGAPSEKEDTFCARAAVSAYVVLSGPWFLLALGYVVLAVRRPSGNFQLVIVMCLSVGFLWILWLRGFRLRVTSEQLEYRNGLYRSVTIPLNAITAVKNTWIEWKQLGQRLRVPRLVIVYGNRRSKLAINVKPFKKDDLHVVINVIQNAYHRNINGHN